MPLTLTVVATAGGDAAALTVAGASTAGPVQLVRLDRSGQSPVRTPAGLNLAGGTVAFTDYEVALVGQARWLAVDAAGASAEATLTLAPSDARPQLRPVFGPLDIVRVTAVLELPAARTLAASEHRVLGRPDVVLTTFGMGLREGELLLRCPSLADALATQAVYASGAPVRLRLADHAGLDLVHIGRGVQVLPQPRKGDGTRWWDVRIQALEVVPSGAMALLAWTLADVDATFPTLGSAALSYATLGDLATDTRRTA